MIAVAERLAALVVRLVGDDCVGVYLYGSAVTGGLRPDSDVDVLVVTETSLSEEVRRQLTGELLRVSGRWPVRESEHPVELTTVVRGDVVPWRHPTRRDFQYGEWLRDEFEAGAVPEPENDPDLAVLITLVRQAAVVLAGRSPREVLDPIPSQDVMRAMRDGLPELIGDMDGDERNVVLTLARMWTTAETGEILSKDAAAERVAAQLDGQQREIVELARAAYVGDVTDDWTGLGEPLHAFVERASEVVAARR